VTQGPDLPPALQQEIDAAIEDSQSEWKKFANRNRGPEYPGDPLVGRPLAMKYVPSKWAKDFLPRPGKNSFPPPNSGVFFPSPTKGFFIGNKDFTWGKAVYVTGVNEPLSTATYGRVGLVSWFDPDEPPWRAFDARDKKNADLYLDWLKLQPTYNEAILTVHTNHWLHGLRNQFREQFKIDVVLCHPDEQDESWWYTDPTDTWLCVSDFVPNPPSLAQGKLAADEYSARFPDVRLTVVAEEEFVISDELVRPPAPPHSRVRQLAVSRKPPRVPSRPDVREAYWTGKIARVKS
jgi:hypothetical protein